MHMVISVSYKKLAHDLDLQVTMMGRLDKVQIGTVHNIQLASHGFLVSQAQ